MGTKTGHWLLAALATPALALAPGCLVYETTHTLYLEPDGAVRWLILQKDVRSASNEESSRRDEEREFVGAVRTGEHPAARDLWAVGANRVETRVIRDERPYAVATEGEFDSIDALARAFLERLGVRAEVQLRRDGSLVELSILLDSREEETEAEASWEPPASLLGDAGDYRLVLTEGRFVHAVGFELEDDDTAAVPVALLGDDIEHGDVVSYELTWRVHPKQGTF